MPAADYGKWLQCPICGTIVSVNSIRYENELTGVIEVKDPNSNTLYFEAIDNKKDKHTIGIRRYKNRSEYKDPDKEIQDIIGSGADIVVHQ